MAKIKYYYDTESCRYERIKVTNRDIFWNLTGFIAVSLVLAVIIFFVYNTYFEPPEVAELRKENQELKYHIDLLEVDVNQAKDMLDALQDRDDKIYRVILGAEPIPENVRTAGFGGSDRYKELQGISQEELIRDNYQKLDALKKQLYIQTKSYDEIVSLAKRKEEMLSSMPAIQPVSNEDLKFLTSGYGYRIDPVLRTPRMHYGVDYSMPIGSNVYATGDGKVVKVETKFSGFGKLIEIDHGFGMKTRYAHLNAFNVRLGQQVKRGELIGDSGNTGKSTGPHLHYEVLINGQNVNPVYYMYKDLTPEEYEEILRLASTKNVAQDSY
jgi:hypothetical protein